MKLLVQQRQRKKKNNTIGQYYNIILLIFILVFTKDIHNIIQRWLGNVETNKQSETTTIRNTNKKKEITMFTIKIIMDIHNSYRNLP